MDKETRKKVIKRLVNNYEEFSKNAQKMWIQGEPWPDVYLEEAIEILKEVLIEQEQEEATKI
jgi:hypothetical protein